MPLLELLLAHPFYTMVAIPLLSFILLLFTQYASIPTKRIVRTILYGLTSLWAIAWYMYEAKMASQGVNIRLDLLVILPLIFAQPLIVIKSHLRLSEEQLFNLSKQAFDRYKKRG